MFQKYPGFMSPVIAKCGRPGNEGHKKWLQNAGMNPHSRATRIISRRRVPPNLWIAYNAIWRTIDTTTKNPT